jgi:hypothetical protein
MNECTVGKFRNFTLGVSWSRAFAITRTKINVMKS